MADFGILIPWILLCWLLDSGVACLEFSRDNTRSAAILVAKLQAFPNAENVVEGAQLAGVWERALRPDMGDKLSRAARFVFVRFTPIQRPNLVLDLPDLTPIFRVIFVRFSPGCAGSVDEVRRLTDHCTAHAEPKQSGAANE